MQVHDDSMTAPAGAGLSFPRGCFVYFERTSEHRSGDAVLLQINGAIVFTTLCQVNGAWMMTPLNARFPARDLPHMAKVIGVAYGMMALFRQR